MHLVVGRLGEHGRFEILTSEKEMVRLGQGGGEMKELAEDAIERGIATLARMAKVARSFGEVEVVAVATSAVREAANQHVFLDRARDEVGIEVEVISGFEEARLIHLGVLQALPVFDKRLLVVDVGGGSTEILIGKAANILEARSMKLGAIRLTQRFFADAAAVDDNGVVSGDAVEECRNYVRAALAPVANELGGHQPEMAVVSSGTATTVAAMALAARGEQNRKMNGVVFSAAEVSSVAEIVVSASTAERGKIAGLDSKRVDIIVAGAILLDEICSSFQVKEMTVSSYALREGLLFDRFGPAAGDELSDLRRTNVLRLAKQLDPDPVHSEYTAKLACQLFDRTNQLHSLDSAARELLEAASIVHNVGLFISHSSHHKHSYYVIRNSERLTGFTHNELELIALIARYHRKSLPSDKHSDFAALSKADKALVRTLSGLMRIAIGLDRRHAQVVHSVRVFIDQEDQKLTIEPVGDPESDLELEIYAANDRAALLGLALGVEIEVVLPRESPSEHLSS